MYSGTVSAGLTYEPSHGSASSASSARAARGEASADTPIASTARLLPTTPAASSTCPSWPSVPDGRVADAAMALLAFLLAARQHGWTRVAAAAVARLVDMAPVTVWAPGSSPDKKPR
jgi:hypothetical protein